MQANNIKRITSSHRIFCHFDEKRMNLLHDSLNCIHFAYRLTLTKNAKIKKNKSSESDDV